MSLGVDVHPSPTGGDGRQIPTSRYKKRSDPVENFITCAQCGFHLDLNKTPNGMSTGAVTSYVAHSTTVNLPVPKGAAPISFTDQYADPQRTTGCPFCGSMNIRGIGQNRPWGNNKDISNL